METETKSCSAEERSMDGKAYIRKKRGRKTTNRLYMREVEQSCTVRSMAKTTKRESSEKRRRERKRQKGD